MNHKNKSTVSLIVCIFIFSFLPLLLLYIKLFSIDIGYYLIYFLFGIPIVFIAYLVWYRFKFKTTLGADYKKMFFTNLIALILTYCIAIASFYYYIYSNFYMDVL